jgi:hypothetical protein
MSSTELKVVKKDGEVVSYKEYKNAWGGAAYIWTKIYKKYLANPSIEYDSWMFNSEALWALSEDESIPLYVRFVLSFTFDRVIIENEKIPKMVEYFREFIKEFSNSKEWSHLEDWVNDMLKIYNKGDYLGVCLNATSVSPDPWYIYDEDKDEGHNYNINKDEGHWFLFKVREEEVAKS